jgi:hypothetical protein
MDLIHVILTKNKHKFKNQKKYQKEKIEIPPCTLHSSVDVEKLSVVHYCQFCLHHSMTAECFPALNFLKMCLPKIKAKVNCLIEVNK